MILKTKTNGEKILNLVLEKIEKLITFLRLKLFICYMLNFTSKV